MLSSRSIYSNETEFYRRSDHRGMSLGHSSSLGEQYESNSQPSRNNSPQSDLDSKSAPPRKRVPVACGRCRKRKIKCSGDEGGNTGCSNCRNAGFAGCQFLRVGLSYSDGVALYSLNQVQSSELGMGMQYQAVKGWPLSHRYSPYSSGGSSRCKPFASIQYTDSTAYGGLPTGPNFDPYQTSAITCSYSRPNYVPHYGLTYSEEPASHYSTQPPPPSYMLPNTDPMNNTNSCYLSGLGRAQQTSLWVDPGSSAGVAPTMTPPSGSNTHTSYGLQENSVSIHAINSSSTDRILPTLSASRTLAAAPQSSLDTQCLSALSHRSSLGWNTDTPSSTSAASSRTSNSTDSDSRVLSAGPFGYIDVSASTQELADTSVGMELSHSPNDLRRSSDDSRNRIGSRESHGLGHSPRDTMNYPYTSSRSIRNQHASSGRLMSGQVYHPVPNTSTARGSIQQDCSPNLHDLSHDGTWQSNSQRSSVASLSNSSSFSNIH